MKIKDLFYVKYGINLELNALEIVTNDNAEGVNFVARTSSNNGVVARVKQIEDMPPQPSGIITCAGGGSVLSTFVQDEPFYSGRDLYLLIPKTTMSLPEKLFYCMCINANAYRYSYGRQANRTMRDIELPDDIPEWVYEKSCQPIQTSIIRSDFHSLNTSNWEYFNLEDIFVISVSKDNNLVSSSEGTTPYIASSSENNGVTSFIEQEPSQKAGTLTLARNGSVGSTFYQPIDYCASPDDIRILTPRFEINVYIGLFLKVIIEMEKYKYGYGRKLGTNRIKNTCIKLPVKEDRTPDWEFMEEYIRTLPYSDRLA